MQSMLGAIHDTCATGPGPTEGGGGCGPTEGEGGCGPTERGRWVWPH